MGVVSYNQEISSPISPPRLFKAFLDTHNLFPKLIPESVISTIEFVKGDCIAVGAIKQVNFSEGSPFKYLKHRIDELDVDNCYCKYTTIEGDILEDIIECCVNEAKFVASGTGSVCNILAHYHPKEGAVLDEERIKIGQENVNKIFMKVEEYLRANPNAYA